MRIGFDVDGVLANFFAGYEALTVAVAGGENKFPPDTFPPVWDWPQHYGYSDEIMDKVWSIIRNNPLFWAKLDTLPGLEFLVEFDNYSNDLYFITDRPGNGAKFITQIWLAENLGYIPSTIISKKGKGIVAQALALDFYIDDKVENILDCQEKSPETRAYLAPQYPYNLDHKDFSKVLLTQPTVKEVLIAERLI
jgi:hypothetical protein